MTPPARARYRKNLRALNLFLGTGGSDEGVFDEGVLGDGGLLAGTLVGGAVWTLPGGGGTMGVLPVVIAGEDGAAGVGLVPDIELVLKGVGTLETAGSELLSGEPGEPGPVFGASANLR